MVTRYGMSRRAGPDGLRRERGRGLPRPLGHDARRTCPKRRCRRSTREIRSIIDQQYALARKLIEDNRDKVEAMAKALLEFETIDADQIDDIMAGPSAAAAEARASATPGTTPGGPTPARRRAVARLRPDAKRPASGDKSARRRRTFRRDARRVAWQRIRDRCDPRCGSYRARPRARRCVMGIVNVTPDSFSDGGRSRRTRRGARARAGRCGATAPTSSTSAANRRARARRRSTEATSSRA